MTQTTHRLTAGLLLLAPIGCDVPQSEEVALGAQAAQQVEAQLPIVDDPAVASYVQALGSSIAGPADQRGLEWRFAVVNSAQVNAFALPGGYIYVNRGLIERAEQLSELAGVLGHEVAHVTLRHSVEQMQKAQKANIGVVLLCTLTDVCERPAAQVAISVGGAALFARHSREDEREADAEGIRHVVRAGYDPRGIPRMFTRLLEERQRRPALLDAWFGTHPLEEQRIADTRRRIAELDPAALATLTRDDASFHAFTRRLAALPPPPDRDAPPR